MGTKPEPHHAHVFVSVDGIGQLAKCPSVAVARGCLFPRVIGACESTPLVAISAPS